MILCAYRGKVIIHEVDKENGISFREGMKMAVKWVIWLFAWPSSSCRRQQLHLSR